MTSIWLPNSPVNFNPHHRWHGEAFDSCSTLSYIFFTWFPLSSTSLIFLLPHCSFLLRLLCCFHSSAIPLILERPGLNPQSYSFLYLDSPFVDVIQSHSSKYYAWASDFQLHSYNLHLFPEFQVYLHYTRNSTVEFPKHRTMPIYCWRTSDCSPLQSKKQVLKYSQKALYDLIPHYFPHFLSYYSLLLSLCPGSACLLPILQTHYVYSLLTVFPLLFFSTRKSLPLTSSWLTSLSNLCIKCQLLDELFFSRPI